MKKKNSLGKQLSFFQIFLTTFLVLLIGLALEVILHAINSAINDPSMLIMFLTFLFVDPHGFFPLFLFFIPIPLYALLYALLMRNQRVSFKYVILFNSALVLYYVMLTFLRFLEITPFMQFFKVLPYSGFIGFFIFLLAQYFLILYTKKKKETKWFLAFGLAVASVILLYGIFSVASSVLWIAKTEPCQYFEQISVTVPAVKQSEWLAKLGLTDYRDKVVVEILAQRCLRENDQQWIYFTAKVINVEDYTISWWGGVGIEGVDYVYSEVLTIRNLLPVISYILTARDTALFDYIEPFDLDIKPGESRIAFYKVLPSSETITITGIEQYISQEKSDEQKAHDLDRDGLMNEEEIAYGTDPANKDTDDDELSDAEEVMTYQTDPNDSDTDDNGYTDYDEVHIAGTDPLDVTDYSE